jgi:hypothetical protein
MVGGLGSLFTPYINEYDDYYLASGELEPFEMSETDLSQFLAAENVPVLVQNELQWSENLSVDDF